jgi:type IV pilus assembly protein PilW
MINSASKSQKGLSLVELMVAIVLGVFIAAALISLFINSKQNYRINENMSRLQENGRFAVSFLSRDLRMADYRPRVGDNCPQLSDMEYPPIVFPVEGGNDEVIDGFTSDTLTIRWLFKEGLREFDVDGLLTRDDCDKSDPDNIRNIVYSIEADATGNPGLFRSVDGGDPVLLVEGIESLQILYGEDTDDPADNVPNYYVDAASITDWTQAISVRFTLTVRTLGENISTSGERITRNFDSTIVLRNRLP